MPLSAGLTWRVEGGKTKESSLENPGKKADSQGKTVGRKVKSGIQRTKIFLEKDSQRSIYCREARWQSVVWSFDYENFLEIICWALSPLLVALFRRFGDLGRGDLVEGSRSAG